MSRNFNGPAGQMLERSRTTRLFFIDDKIAFKAVDNDFSDPYADDWLASIEASEAYPSDEVREDEQEQQTLDMLAAMDNSHQVYITSKYYIEKTFGNKPGTLKSFGLDDYEEARNNQSLLTTFMINLHSKCVNPINQALLVAQGMTPAQIANIKTAADNFTNLNQAQNKTIAGTPQATLERDIQYNSTFEFWQRVNKASKVVFYGNAVKLNQYLLPEGPQPDPDINLKGKVVDGSNSNAPLKGVTVVIKELSIETVTNYAGNYNFVSIPAGTYTLSYLISGYANQEIPVTILASGVVVQNVTLVVL